MRKEARNIYSQLVGKKYRVLFIMIWVTLALYIGSPMLAVSSDNMAFMPICGLSGVAFFIIIICYFNFTSRTKKAIRTLVRTNKLDYANEIISENYNSNGKIGFSQHMLYDKKTNIIVAYDDIVWVYKHAKDRYNTEILFCTIDGKKHSSKIDDLTLTEFLKRRSGILVGFTPQNRAAYDMKVKAFKAQIKQ